MVFLGRPIVFGLAVGVSSKKIFNIFKGSDGVQHVLNILRTEFETTMKLAGCSTIPEIRSCNMVMSKKAYAKL